MSLGFVMLGMPARAQPEIALVPVGATIDHTLIDNDANGLDDQIMLSDSGPGVEIDLEVKLLGWSTVAQNLKTWDAHIDSSGYDNDGGALPDLAPLGWPVDPSLGAFIDTTHPDWVFIGFASPIVAVATNSLDYRYGATLFLDDGPVYAPPPKYGASLVLTVPSGAIGTFDVGFLRGSMTDGDANPIEPLMLTPVAITIPEPSTLSLNVTALGALTLLGRRRRRLTSNGVSRCSSRRG